MYCSFSLLVMVSHQAGCTRVLLGPPCAGAASSPCPRRSRSRPAGGGFPRGPAVPASTGDCGFCSPSGLGRLGRLSILHSASLYIYWGCDYRHCNNSQVFCQIVPLTLVFETPLLAISKIDRILLANLPSHPPQRFLNRLYHDSPSLLGWWVVPWNKNHQRLNFTIHDEGKPHAYRMVPLL